MPAFVSILTALGWSLLDSFWQLAAVWTAYYFLTADNKRMSAAGKHNLAFMFVAIGSGWFVYSFIHLLNEPVTPIVPGFIPGAQSVNRWIPWLGLVYLFILIIRLVQYGLQSYTLNKNKSAKSLSPVFQSFAERYARLIGISRRVQVYLSEMAETAVTGGFFKPWILLPATLVTRLSPQQLEAILVHELFHIRRNDYLINIFMYCFRSIFFFNPFAYLFFKAIARERELACDDGVLERDYPPVLYAEALYSLEKLRQPQPGLLIAADGNRPWLLMERIRRVLGKPEIKKNRFNPLFFFGLIAASALFGLQQKSSLSDPKLRPAINQAQIIPRRYEFSSEKMRINEKTVSSSAGRRRVKKEFSKKPLPLVIREPERAEEQDVVNQVFFADNNIVKNYSNQLAAGENIYEVPAVPGAPYLPSVSLSYEAIPGVKEADSLRQNIIISGIHDMIRDSRIKEIVNLNRLATEMQKNNNDLKRIEIQNRTSISIDQKNIRPMLDKIHREMKLKERKINRMRIQLRNSEEEIIHI